MSWENYFVKINYVSMICCFSHHKLSLSLMTASHCAPCHGISFPFIHSYIHWWVIMSVRVLWIWMYSSKTSTHTTFQNIVRVNSTCAQCNAAHLSSFWIIHACMHGKKYRNIEEFWLRKGECGKIAIFGGCVLYTGNFSG